MLCGRPTEGFRTPTMKENDRLRVDKDFWAVAYLFRDEEKQWRPVNAGYDLRRLVTVDGKNWTICLKVHAIVDDHVSRAKRSRQIRFQSSVTLWPPRLAPTGEERLAQTGWYKAVAKAVRAGGYRGKWMESPSGRFGDFWKDLSTVAEVRREAVWLAHLALESLAPVLQMQGGTQPRGANRKRLGR